MKQTALVAPRTTPPLGLKSLRMIEVSGPAIEPLMMGMMKLAVDWPSRKVSVPALAV